MRRMFFVAVAAIGLMVSTAGIAQAGKSCPSGSRFVGGQSGGVCVGIGTGDLVKQIRN